MARPLFGCSPDLSLPIPLRQVPQGLQLAVDTMVLEKQRRRGVLDTSSVSNGRVVGENLRQNARACGQVKLCLLQPL